MSVILFLIFGLIVGALARLIVPGREPGGWLTSLVIGVAGSFLGGFLGRVFGLYTREVNTARLRDVAHRCDRAHCRLPGGGSQAHAAVVRLSQFLTPDPPNGSRRNRFGTSDCDLSNPSYFGCTMAKWASRPPGNVSVFRPPLAALWFSSPRCGALRCTYDFDHFNPQASTAAGGRRAGGRGPGGCSAGGRRRASGAHLRCVDWRTECRSKLCNARLHARQSRDRCERRRGEPRCDRRSRTLA